LLATWETLIGLGLLSGFAMRATLLLLFLQMPGTILPLFFSLGNLDPIPVCAHLEGQYIIKNLVLISAGIVLGATVRGGHMTAEQTGDESWALDRRLPAYFCGVRQARSTPPRRLQPRAPFRRKVFGKVMAAAAIR
jgi:hypothetical protein